MREEESRIGAHRAAGLKMDQKEEFKKFGLTIAIVTYHIVIIMLFIFGCWLIDNFTKLLGYHDSPLSGLLNNYLDPIMLLCLFTLTVVTIIRIYSPNKNDENPRLEIEYENETTAKAPLIITANAAKTGENEEIYQ